MLASTSAERNRGQWVQSQAGRIRPKQGSWRNAVVTMQGSGAARLASPSRLNVGWAMHIAMHTLGLLVAICCHSVGHDTTYSGTKLGLLRYSGGPMGMAIVECMVAALLRDAMDAPFLGTVEVGTLPGWRHTCACVEDSGIYRDPAQCFK